MIKIFSSFCDTYECKKNFEHIWGMTNITTGDDYTHVIILNTAMPDIKHIPKQNVIGLAYEPPAFLNLTPAFIAYAKKYINKYYIGESTLGAPFIETYSYMFHMKPLPIQNKTKLMSIMVSQKKIAPGHKYRHELVQGILKTTLPIDIYGRGCTFYKDERIKGEFKEEEPYSQYVFHICIENFQVKHYFSEKIINPLLCNTMPIYLGCTSINSYFSNIIMLSGKVEKDIRLLEDIILYPRKYLKSINVEKIKADMHIKNIF